MALILAPVPTPGNMGLNYSESEGGFRGLEESVFRGLLR